MNNHPQKNTDNDFDFERAKSYRQNIQNPYADSFREDNAERRIKRQNSGYDFKQSRRKVRKKQSKLNWGPIVFLIVIAVVVIVSAVQMSKKPKNPAEDEYVAPPTATVEDDKPPVEPNVPNENPDIVTEDETSDEPSLKTFTVTTASADADSGDLILVNYDHDFSENADYIPVINTYEKRTTHFKVAGTDICLSPLAFEAFEKMVSGLEKATGCDDLIINSGYRTMNDQQEIYDYYLDAKGAEYVKDYVANPGESEHHTGFAADLSFYLDEGYSENVGIHEHGSWLVEHCSDYGFVVRYPEDKVEYTHIAYEPWHFRYVGVVHAKAMTSLGLCLEEYIDLLDGCTLGEKVLYLSSDGKASLMDTDSLPTDSGYVIYSVPVSDGAYTELTIYGSDGADYTYSGTNTEMFVITVPLG